MAIKLLLDTNAVIALLNENAGIIESVITADEIKLLKGRLKASHITLIKSKI